MNKKGQIVIPLFMIFIVFIVFVVLFFKILSLGGIEITRTYSENLLEADSMLFTLLNYNTCDKEIKLPMKELIGLSIIQGKDSILVDYNGESKEINVKKCLSKLLGKMSEEIDKKYDFYVKYNGKNYLTLTKIKDEKKITTFKLVPIPDEKYGLASVILSVEMPAETELVRKGGKSEEE